MAKPLAVVAWLLAVPALGQTATVTWSETYQTMDGFGGQTWVSADSLTAAQADLFFSPTNGIGLSIVRTANTSDGSVPDLVTLQEAVARGANVELSLQSPPAAMKDSNDFDTGGSFLAADYGAYVTYIVGWIQNLASQGVPVDVVSIQNEPNIDSSSLGACLWTAAQFDTFVGQDLGPAFADAGIASRIMLPEMSSWFDTDLVSTTLADPVAAPYVSIVAGHGYGTGSVDGTNTGYCCHDATAPPSSVTTQHVWMSEVNGGFNYNSTAGLWNWDPSMADALVWAHSIHDYLTIANASGWEYWELADCCSGGGSPLNDGLTDASFNPAQRFYAVGNWSKFVRPGWLRMDATANPASGIYVTAFQNPGTGGFAIVAVNENGADTSQSFALAGFSPTSVTPWLTSATSNLAAQSAITVSGGAFMATLPAQSVTTFVGGQTVSGTTTTAGTTTTTGTTTAGGSTSASAASTSGAASSAASTASSAASSGSTASAGTTAATTHGTAAASSGTSGHATSGGSGSTGSSSSTANGASTAGTSGGSAGDGGMAVDQVNGTGCGCTSSSDTAGFAGLLGFLRLGRRRRRD